VNKIITISQALPVVRVRRGEAPSGLAGRTWAKRTAVRTNDRARRRGTI